MQAYDGVPGWVLEQSPEDAFFATLMEGVAAVLSARSETGTPLEGLALEIRPRSSSIELCLSFDPEGPAEPPDWDPKHNTTAPDLSPIWESVRAAFGPERQRWNSLDGVHPKAGALYLSTMLTDFVFNLDTGPVADALEAMPLGPGLRVVARNYEDPTLPDIFEVETGRSTFFEPPEPSPRPKPPRLVPKPRPEDPNQMKLFES